MIRGVYNDTRRILGLRPVDERIEAARAEATQYSVSPETRLGAFDIPAPRSVIDAESASEMNIAYQRALARWKALPLWKRMWSRMPAPPRGI